jgi:hypothetical protein
LTAIRSIKNHADKEAINNKTIKAKAIEVQRKLSFVPIAKR